MRAVLLALLMLFPQILFAGTPIFSQEKIGNEPVVKILYNRGDDGNLSREQFFELVENLEKQLTNEIGVPAKQGRSSKKKCAQRRIVLAMAMEKWRGAFASWFY